MSASQIVPNLWMGDIPPLTPKLGEKCDVLLLAAKEYQPDITSEHIGGVEVFHTPLYDDYQTMPAKDKAQAITAAKLVVKKMGAGQKVLVTCHLGFNRSGLISALALMLGPSKMSSDEAIARVRSARGPFALNNPHFVHLLKLMESETHKPS